jgi:circadian clock protein KaiB
MISEGGSDVNDSIREFEEASKRRGERYVLKLYVSGMTTRSLQAIENLKKICDGHLPECYDLEVIDIGQQPDSVTREDIVATPTLIKELPKPIRRIIGDLGDNERVLVALNLVQSKIYG